ncbi:MAG: hypothetical protein WCK51_04555 [Armatimonadota bacterium]
MKNLLLASLAVFALAGCKPPEPEVNAPPSPDANTPAPTAQAGGGGVAPMASGAAGGMTPISGTDSVQGAGGGSTSMAAKGWAKDKINNTPSSSAGQMPADEGN